MINVYIVSGFLGAGKTTFIQKLLSEKKFEKVMLLENEFGEVGVDSAFFSKNLAVREINNGCICCSLQGDFEEALEEIEDMEVTDLIIEPSGVGKLSEIINVIRADDDFRIVSHICIVDVKTCRKYHQNFGEYFNDQVKAANAIILSHVDVADEKKIEEARELVRELNEDAEILDSPIAE
jgi:G3E family GTPase